MNDPHENETDAASNAPADQPEPGAPAASTSPSSPPPPPPVDTAEEGTSKLAWVGAVVLGVAVFLFVAWLIWGGPARLNPRTCLPANTVFCIHAPDLERLDALAHSPVLWKEGRNQEAAKHLRKDLIDHIAKALGDVRTRDVEDLLHLTRSVGIGWAPGETGALRWIIVLSVQDVRKAESILKNDLWPMQTQTAMDETRATRVQRTDGTSLWYTTLRNGLVLTPDKNLIRFASPLPDEQDQTLASLGLFVEDEEEAAIYGMVDLRSLRLRQFAVESRVKKLFLGETMWASIFNKEQTHRLQPEGRWVFTVRGGEEPPRTTMRLAAVSGTEAHGFLYYAAWVILTPIALILLTLLTIIALTLLLALYFYVVAWWKGELSPPAPTPTPELSPELNEDLGRKPDRDGADAPPSEGPK